MELLMYFAAFGTISVLFVSVIVLLSWLLKNCIRAVLRLYRALTDAEYRSAEAKTKPLVLDTIHLKRAGQW
jgi:hypothetical protein